MTTFPYRVTCNGITIDGGDLDALYALEREGIGGLDLPAVVVTDAQRVGHGAVAGSDWATARLLTIPTIIHQADDPEGAMQLWRALKAAWAPLGAGETELTVTITGLGPADDTLRFYGRPRSGGQVSLRNLAAGNIAALLGFTATDPVGYGAAATLAVPAATPTVITNEGDAPTDRATITVTGDGSVPLIALSNGRSIAFATAVPNAATWTIDLRARTVVDAGGVDRRSAISTASSWFSFPPGESTVTATGVTSLSIEYQSGWW